MGQLWESNFQEERSEELIVVLLFTIYG
ncbi:uncharacterized protein METZ01_LOCUS180088 [marine metagenome]|uniref:Uncharacterized protein n=1 Tax=marine metagenome TaxID=408172 RepID=A0A382CN20_9ZZZZ